MNGAPATVFMGPSLDVGRARQVFEAEYLPPVKRGDIARLVERSSPPRAIGLVDGNFHQNLSISPKEILTALDMGVPVFGAASIGALRAVECAPFGMVGVGRVYEAYRSGKVDADDEVAVLCEEESHRALTDPLISIRLAIEDAVAGRVFAAATGIEAIAIAKSLHYSERRAMSILTRLRDKVDDHEYEAIERYLLHEAEDAKREDALSLLATMREFLEQGDK